MSLKDTVNQDIKAAMKAKDQAKLRALRSLKSVILNAEVAEGRNGQPLTEDEDLKILMKAAKQRKDSIEQYKQNKREDLAATEMEELTVIEAYLPKQMSAEELEVSIKGIIEEVGASSMKDMGKVMGIASKKFAGKADGKAISGIVKQLLA
ncbi:MAG: GatB/YqeY domain-containing protein [Bacteroidia bacterium]|nr:GatB/YqeY domain-containing protein [Bacteroidia bacterium]